MNEAAIVVGLDDGVDPASRYAELRQLQVRHVADLDALREVLQVSAVPVILSLGEKLGIRAFHESFAWPMTSGSRSGSLTVGVESIVR